MQTKDYSLAPIGAVTPQQARGRQWREEYERIAGISSCQYALALDAKPRSYNKNRASLVKTRFLQTAGPAASFISSINFFLSRSLLLAITDFPVRTLMKRTYSNRSRPK